MNVAIPTEFEPYLDQLVATGVYPSTEAAVEDALAQLRDRQSRFEQLRSSIEEGIAELDRGEAKPLDFEEIKRMGRERLAARNGR